MTERTWPSQTSIFFSSGALVAFLLLGFVALGILGDAYEPLGDFPRQTLDWVRHNGPGSAVAALYAEESGVPVLLPGDVFVVYIGRHVSSPVGWLTAWLALIVAIVLGATNLYWISRRWGRRLVLGAPGRLLHLTPERLARAERWFGRYGVWALIFGRHIPGFRIPITVAAGTLQVRYRAFAASVAVSSAIWAGVLLVVGIRFGRQFERSLFAHRLALGVAGPILLGVIILVSLVRHRLTAGRAIS